MAIEIIPKSKIKETPWLKIALYLLGAAFLAFLLSYFILAFYQKKFTEKRSEVETALARTPAQTALEKEVLSWQKRTEDVAPLLAAHQWPINFFDFLEQNTHPKILFSDLKLIPETGVAALSGAAASFEVLSQQLLIFEKESFVQESKLSGVAISREGAILFDLQLTFDPRQLK